MQKFIAIGRLGKPGELKETINGNMVYSNSLAVSKKVKDKQGNYQEKTEWINFVIWQKGAEVFNRYTQKGSQVYIEGELETQTYEKNGEKKYITKINVRDFRFLDTKGGAEKANSDSSFASNDLGF
jgi:single-strand DNA-binding protein